MSRDRLRQSISSGLRFLKRVQEPCGRLPSLAGFGEDLAMDCVPDVSPFVAAFTWPCLEPIGHPDAAAIREGIVDYLIGVAEPPGVWRYWGPEVQPIDADLDDTACASIALRQRHLAVMLGANVPAILANRDERGRFKTWLRTPERPNDVDSVVNANVVAYLGERPETAAAVSWLLEIACRDRITGSSWYYRLEEAAFDYCLARAFAAGVLSLGVAATHAIRRCERRLAGMEDAANALEIAMLLNVASVFGPASRKRIDDAAIERAADALRQAQRADGSWPRSAFYQGPEPPAPRSVFFGGEALSTALCVEALWRLRQGHV